MPDKNLKFLVVDDFSTMRRKKWLRLFGQNIAFLKCSLAVYCLRCFWQHGQVVAVELIRCLVVKRRMRPKLVVEREILL